MKIITSMAVFTESQRVGQEVARLIEPNFRMPLLSQQLDMMDKTYNALQHYKFSVDPQTQDVTIEVDDKVLIAILALYGKVANVVGMAVGVLKTLWPTLKADCEAVGELIATPREPRE